MYHSQLELASYFATQQEVHDGEIQRNANKHTAQHRVQKGSKITDKQLKVFYFTYDDKYKKNFGKSLREILVLVS